MRTRPVVVSWLAGGMGTRWFQVANQSLTRRVPATRLSPQPDAEADQDEHTEDHQEHRHFKYLSGLVMPVTASILR